MPSGLQITCANKSVDGRIIRVGGDNWSFGLYEIITAIDSGQIRLSILIGDEYFDIGVRGTDRDAYLVLEPEGTPLSEVAGLHSC